MHKMAEYEEGESISVVIVAMTYGLTFKTSLKIALIFYLPNYKNIFNIIMKNRKSPTLPTT